MKCLATVADTTAAPADADDDWVIDRLFGEDAAPGPQPQVLDADFVATQPFSPGPRLNGPVADDVTDQVGDDGDAVTRHPAVWLGGAVSAAAFLIAGAFLLSDASSQPAPPATRPEQHAAGASAVPRATVPPAPTDQAIPFSAAAPGCKSGSTPAQVLSVSTGDSPWVCVRGTPDEQADGQVIHLDFRCDAARPAAVCSYLVTSVSVTPGSVSAAPDGHDDWLAHRVVSRLQYNFYNGNELVDILTQDTGSVHGPASTGLRHPVLASRVVVIVLQTARPPVSPLPLPNPAAGPQPGLGDPGSGASQMPAPTPSSTVSDPVDATFALSGLQFFGHQPN